MTRVRWPFSVRALDLLHEVVHLALGGLDLDGGVDQAGGADDLLDDLLAVLVLVGAGRGADVDGLIDVALELVEGEGAVVGGGGEAEAVVYQRDSCGSGRRRTCHAPGAG